jgi:hypothetical protein
MEDASSSPAQAPRAALHAALHYVLEPEWPHRAVPVGPRHQHHAAAGAMENSAEPQAAGQRRIPTAA